MYRTRLHNTYLLGIAKVSDIHRFGLDVVLQRFFSEMRKLSSIGFSCADGNGEVHRIQGSLAAVVADTLAAHQLLGFKEGAGFANRKCRNCLAEFNPMEESYIRFHSAGPAYCHKILLLMVSTDFQSFLASQTSIQ